jgi:hypothetical protein
MIGISKHITMLTAAKARSFSEAVGQRGSRLLLGGKSDANSQPHGSISDLWIDRREVQLPGKLVPGATREQVLLSHSRYCARSHDRAHLVVHDLPYLTCEQKHSRSTKETVEQSSFWSRPLQSVLVQLDSVSLSWQSGYFPAVRQFGVEKLSAAKKELLTIVRELLQLQAWRKSTISRIDPDRD